MINTFLNINVSFFFITIYNNSLWAYLLLLGSYKLCNHPHPPTLSQKMSHSHPPTPSRKKVKLTHTHPHPAKKRSQAPTPSQKNGHTQLKKGHTHPYKTERKCHLSSKWYIRENYCLSIILARVLLFDKDWPVNLFLLNIFETAFESIACLFVFND